MPAAAASFLRSEWNLSGGGVTNSDGFGFFAATPLADDSDSKSLSVMKKMSRILVKTYNYNIATRIHHKKNVGILTLRDDVVQPNLLQGGGRVCR